METATNVDVDYVNGLKRRAQMYSSGFIAQELASQHPSSSYETLRTALVKHYSYAVRGTGLIRRPMTAKEWFGRTLTEEELHVGLHAQVPAGG